MEKLIKALQIFLKYKNNEWPTHCEHDVLYVTGITEEEVSEEDRKELDALGFIWSESDDSWISYKFGSS